MKIRLEIIDDQGMKTTIDFEGRLCRERIISTIDALVLGSGSSSTDSSPYVLDDKRGDLTIKERLESFLRFDYPRTWFTSLEAKENYERMYGERINLSTVSTYLARMYRNGTLERRGSRRQREYLVADSTSEQDIGLSSDIDIRLQDI